MWSGTSEQVCAALGAGVEYGANNGPGVTTSELAPMRWGPVPSWCKKKAKETPAIFDARAEMVAKRSMFHTAFKRNRTPAVRPRLGFYLTSAWLFSETKGSHPLILLGKYAPVAPAI
jgi:hypothetical protein